MIGQLYRAIEAQAVERSLAKRDDVTDTEDLWADDSEDGRVRWPWPGMYRGRRRRLQDPDPEIDDDADDEPGDDDDDDDEGMV